MQAEETIEKTPGNKPLSDPKNKGNIRSLEVGGRASREFPITRLLFFYNRAHMSKSMEEPGIIRYELISHSKSCVLTLSQKELHGGVA